MSQPQLVLASGSPRRRGLLEEAGYRFTVVAPRDGAEQAGLCSGCGPADVVVDLAVSKLDDVLEQLEGQGADGPMIVVAADTVAECDGEILGKPRDEDHARWMLQRLSGKLHRVYTGVALAIEAADHAERVTAEVIATVLRMDPLSEQWIDAYLESGQWEGKAGAFGYQDGLGFVHVESGSESNVVGLPMEYLTERLAEAGCFPTAGGQA
ncbi:Maf family protein [Botrimarina sp.]|uniref:Maf family protein n=1 Tax=Botrimarina sp. TaxID=2795802 RepID=UPI0032EC0B16